MTIQKQLSHLSFAAIMLVFAALPALAQTGSADNQTAVVTTSNSVASEQVAAVRTDRVSVPTIVVTPPVNTNEKPQPSFSATQFIKSVTASAEISNSTAFEFTTIEKPRTETSSKSITFVPSRGPKLPWQQ